MSFVIYGIVDPRSRGIFYIGQTSRLDLRIGQHGHAADTVCGLIIKEILAEELEPQFVVLQSCESERAALMAEIFFLAVGASRWPTAKLLKAIAPARKRSGGFGPNQLM